MVRTMYDSVTPAAIPRSAALVAGYLAPSRYAWSATDWNRFPASTRKIRISISARVNDGHVLDVEPGDATPEQAPGWCVMRRKSGLQYPVVYCNLSTWDRVRNAFIAENVPQPLYWIARYDNRPMMIPGAIAKQYADPNTHGGGHYDLSVVADYWPGIDPTPAVPTKPVPTKPEEEMTGRDLLNTDIGTDANDELAEWNGKPGTLGHFLYRQQQYLRQILSKLDNSETKEN